MALKHYLKGYEKSENQLYIRASIINGIGLCYQDKKEPFKAINYFNSAFNLADSIKNEKLQTLVLLNLSSTYLSIKNIDSSLVMLTKAEELAKKNNYTLFQANAALIATEINIEKRNFDEAHQILNKSDAVAKKLGLNKILVDNLLIRSKIYEQQRNFMEALRLHKKYTTAKDSLFQERNNFQLNEIQESFELQVKDKQLEEEKIRNTLLEQEQKNFIFQSTIVTSSLLIIVLILIILFGRFKYRLKIKREARDFEKKLLHKELERKEFEKRILNEDLKTKNKDLTSFAINISKRHELSQEILVSLKKLKSLNNQNKKDQFLVELIRNFSYELNIYDDISVLHANIEKVNYQFFNALKDKFPNLTKADIYVCGLIRLGLSNKEVAIIKKVSPDSAKVFRHRIRKKLNLSPNEDVVDFLESL